MVDRAAPMPFRLALDEQTSRAQELLRAAQAADPTALGRLGVATAKAAKLTDAQRAIAHELRFSNWSMLKAHIAAMDRERAAIARGAAAPDGDRPTLHIRCGNDIEPALREAGFTGDFLEHAIPYCLGPVIPGPERHAQMARFLVDAFPD